MDNQEVERIALLAKLEFQRSELERFVLGFEQIIRYFEQLRGVETNDVAPTYHALVGEELRTPLREDRRQESLPAEEVLRNAPKSSDDHFRVPKVIE